MRTRTTPAAAALLAAGAFLGWLTVTGVRSDVRAEDKPAAQKSTTGFPPSDEVQRLYDEADLNRAVQMYRFFYPATAKPDGDQGAALPEGIMLTTSAA